MSGSPLDGRVALVAGASSGIGAATARAFADAGAEAHAAARRCPQLGAGVTGHQLDVVDRDAVDALAADLTSRGPVHAIVIAAGINIPRRALAELAPADWDTVIATNLTGAYNVVHAFLDALRRTRGDLILIASVSGQWPDQSGPAYQAAKGGMLAFARAVGFEEHATGVRVTSILPGLVDTPVLDRRPEPPGPEVRAHMLKPEDVAAACVFAAGLPARAHVPELTILPTGLQALGKSNVANPQPPAW